MGNSIQLLNAEGSLYTYRTGQSPSFTIPEKQFQNRVAFSAVHVVSDPFANTDPLTNSQIDWESTLHYRHYIWSLGFAVAEAMDTAQRGMGLNWEMAKGLIRRSVAEAKSVGGRIACGAGTDQLIPSQEVSLDDVIRAYEEQCEFVEAQGGQIILMASRALAKVATSPEDYDKVYRRILKGVSKPIILHWLGDMFDPALAGYWGHENLDNAMEVCLRIIHENVEKVDGIKISLLDAGKEIKMRRLLPKGVRMYTGDDFNYANLIQGDEYGYSDALLGIFDAIAPAAAAALHELDRGNTTKYNEILEKTVPLSRHIFQAPTYSYKTGIVFMAYLNGLQSHFKMIGGAESSRSITHLCELFVLADQAGLLVDPELAIKKNESRYGTFRILRLGGLK